MADTEPQPVLQPIWRPLSLIPVGLKEAALDSPTFRATTVHFSDQVEIVERWLEGYVKATGKFIQEVSGLEELVNSFLARSVPPPNISEAVLDHDYTLLAMKRYGEGAREFWSYTISSMRKMDSMVVDPIRAFLQGELRNFKDARRYLDSTQKTFDSVLARYAAQTKTKEPSALREDAFQVYEARRAYVKASMEYCVLAPQLRSTLDRLLVRIFSDQWREFRRPREVVLGNFQQWSNEMDRVRSWSNEMEAGEKIFRRELQEARRLVEEQAAGAARPSRELEEYAISTVPFLGSKGPSTMQFPSRSDSAPARAEKQGWLFMKTLTGKPTRTLWTRRWFFVKNGIFGWLVQGLRTGGVEQSERIGVLLCNVKPAFQEERRFCFEVKTKDNTILLQTESQSELIEWLESFELAKRKALENSSGTEFKGRDGKEAAFAINPPNAPEFAAKEGQNYGAIEDHLADNFDRTSTLPIPERDGIMNRSSFDITSKKSMQSERESEGGRDPASRIIQKLDLHRSRNAASQSTTAPPANPRAGGMGGGIASLIASSHNILPVYATSSGAPGTPGEAGQGGKSEATISNFATPNVLGQAIKEVPPSTLAPSTLANPPAPTNLSKAAVIVSGERGISLGQSDETGGMPSGIMANMWGSRNWGYMNSLERGEVNDSAPDDPSPAPTSDGSPTRSMALALGPDSPESRKQSASVSTSPASKHRKTISLDQDSSSLQNVTATSDPFPWNYPVQLKTQDAQFRMFFPNAPREDKVLLVFRAAWNPNDQQEFPGRVYVTAKEMFFYSNHLGLVLTTSIWLGSVDEVTAAPGKQCDFLFVHLRQGSSITGETRTTVKVFLEPLRLLQRRLNYLVHNYHKDQPPTLEGLMIDLLKMEKDDGQASPSLESWEDVSINTPVDDRSSAGRAEYLHHSTRERDLRRSVQIHGGLLHDGTASPRARRQSIKFKLPSEPVIYEPKGMAQKVVDKRFDISPKALFHVMFGDKSAVFQMLYYERHAQNIIQSPWMSQEGGHLKREFDYRTNFVNMFGQSQSAIIKDRQTIDVLNDHLCYVVTDRKTPWHLPHKRHFFLVTKIVISHVDKSKCRLAIYTSVVWTKESPAFKGLVEKQALAELAVDANDLADVVSEQVHRLGPRSRTKSAISIFGQVGKMTEMTQLTVGDGVTIRAEPMRVPIRRRSLTHMVFEIALSYAADAVSSIMISVFALLRKLYKISMANYVILAVLALSIFANLLHSSHDVSEWWHERNTGKFMARLGVGPNPMMSRAIYLQDVDEVVSNKTGNDYASQGQCYSTFLSVMEPIDEAITASRAGPSRLLRTRQHLASYRHDLLVAMRVINTVESEIMTAEWERFVGDELRRCQQVRSMIDDGELGYDSDELGNWVQEYCGSCEKASEALVLE